MTKLFELEPFCFSFKVEYNSDYPRSVFLVFFNGDNQKLMSLACQKASRSNIFVI